MFEGKVKWFNESKGYGWIEQEDGEDIFVHCSGLIMEGFKVLDEGDIVTFSTEEGKRGIKAVDVKIISKFNID